MALPTGSRLGPYEIVSPIGAGGMGEVYRARDPRLGRDVAIKLLLPEFSADASRRRRFEQEARAVAALSHPHICAIYDVGLEDHRDYLVIELVDGETLADRLKRGPLPLSEGLARAVEIAGALAAAHRRGIVHRDLKPANIMLTRGGAKVMDFGLAKAVHDDERAGAGLTMTAPLTQTGVVVGTLQYMAPEQIEGVTADGRADVFAFGAVIYEMLTAKRAFAGSSPAAVIGAILRAEAPSLAADQPAVPASLDRLLQACLAKDPDARIASMRDVEIALGWIQRDRESAAAGMAPASARRRSIGWIAGAVLAIGAAVTGYVVGRRPAAAAESHSLVFDMALPPDTKHWAGLALSPDGAHIALVSQPISDGRTDPRLWIRDLGSAAPWQLVSGAGDEIPRFPFWSPDGRSLGYFVGGKLVRVDLPSLVPVQLCDAPDGRGGVWLADGTIVFAPTRESGLQRVGAQGGVPAPLVDRAENESGLKFPVSAGTGRIIYWAQNVDSAQSELRLLQLANPGQATPIVKARAGAAYDHGTLFYLRAGRWVGQALDPASGRLSGEPVPVAVDFPWGGAVVGQPIVAAAGGHVIAENEVPPDLQAAWVDRTGAVQATVGDARPQSQVVISPDGRRFADVRRERGESNTSIWVIDFDTLAEKRLTSEQSARAPIWSPDSKRIAFSQLSGVGGNFNLFSVSSDGTSPITPLLEGPVKMDPVEWRTDGRLVFWTTALAGTPHSLPTGILIREPDGTITTFRASESEEVNGVQVSPDGTRLAYSTTALSQSVLLMDSFPTPSERPAVVARGAVIHPAWSADGRTLFFMHATALMSAAVRASPAPMTGPPVKLFDLPSREYAVDPQSGRLLVLVQASPGTSSVKVVVNWPRK